jgi:hypothetical protein
MIAGARSLLNTAFEIVLDPFHPVFGNGVGHAYQESLVGGLRRARRANQEQRTENREQRTEGRVQTASAVIFDRCPRFSVLCCG